ncbi:MAG: peptidase dimerization domain-containing protein [Candidatus Omnitrophota bacterium]
MNDLFQRKSRGLRVSLGKFAQEISDFPVTKYTVGDLSNKVMAQMKTLGFDKVAKDNSGNIVGVVRGYHKKDHLASVSHIDLPAGEAQSGPGVSSNMLKFKAGLISGIYAGALIKRSLVPLNGDFVVCCVPRVECCDFNIRYLFDESLASRKANLRGVILNEPTDFNLCVGHKGRMEYEIVVKGKLNREFLAGSGVNMLGAMFPLISELEKHSRTLPSDAALGSSSLKIKDVRYGAAAMLEGASEFRVIVNREFGPEEDDRSILEKAKTIARSVYKKEDGDFSISTAVAREKMKTNTGVEIVTQKEFKPWTMESSNPLVVKSLEVLHENGFAASSVGYWKKIITEGSYTYGTLKIPTIGFGAGVEEEVGSNLEAISIDKLERAVIGQALIVHRVIGMPTFGWGTDEI